jgi:hypothetical protein
MNASVKSGIAVVKRLPFMKSADLAASITYNIEALLNLPGRLSFFPTRPTPTEKVVALLERLHPIRYSKGLIRLGSLDEHRPAWAIGDGGYLVPDDLAGITACFSPGIYDFAGFELDCAQRGMKVFMADASVEQLPETHPSFAFTRKFIGAISDGLFITLEDWVHQSCVPDGCDLMLQMDIERHEYETLISTPESLLKRFRIIVVEFHFLDYLFSEPLFALYSRAFEKLLRGHTCVHIHPNNAARLIKIHDVEVTQIAEFTFIRNDRVTDRTFEDRFPHPLDRDCTAEFPPVVLPSSMYRARL